MKKIESFTHKRIFTSKNKQICFLKLALPTWSPESNIEGNHWRKWGRDWQWQSADPSPFSPERGKVGNFQHSAVPSKTTPPVIMWVVWNRKVIKTWPPILYNQDLSKKGFYHCCKADSATGPKSCSDYKNFPRKSPSLPDVQSKFHAGNSELS